AFSEITGYTAEEAIGQTPRILKGGTHPREFYTDLWEKILDGQIWSGVLINRRKDGTPYHQETTISPIRNQYGEIDSFVEIGRDVTEEANTEARLRQAEKMRSDNSLRESRTISTISSRSCWPMRVLFEEGSKKGTPKVPTSIKSSRRARKPRA
ncbi:MAG: PAS domain S-box protein, partial [Candidatus Omnitrophica bacterium]|nr:PAS domain S-box protein [Candidatus Omnitrophota bacterium]